MVGWRISRTGSTPRSRRTDAWPRSGSGPWNPSAGRERPQRREHLLGRGVLHAAVVTLGAPLLAGAVAGTAGQGLGDEARMRDRREGGRVIRAEERQRGEAQRRARVGPPR